MLFFPRYGDTPNTYDALKALAIITMIIDHMGDYFFPHSEIFRVIGRMAFPCFLFLVGYNRSYSDSKTLLVCATLVQISNIWNGLGVFQLNILFAILFTRMLMRLMERTRLLERPYEILLCCVAFFIPATLILDYGVMSLMFACLGFFTRTGRNDKAVKVFWLATALLWMSGQYFLSFHFSPYETLLFVIVAITTLLILRKFEVQPFPSTLAQGTLQNYLTIALSRNALMIYVVHVIAFQTISVYLGIHPSTFSWFGLSS